MTHPKIQHYVPRFLLKGFTRGKKPRLFAFDKWNGRTFSAAVDRLAAVNAFYEVPVEEGIISAEPALGKIESLAAQVVERIRRSASLHGITDTDRALLAILMAVQHLRTQQFREQVKHLDKLIADQLGHDARSVQNWRPLESEEEVKLLSLHMIKDLSGRLADLLLEKDWYLGRTTKATPFWISDNPLTLFNAADFGPHGNIGFAVPGIEIQLPLSETLALYVTCPTNTAEMERAGALAASSPAVQTQAGEVAGTIELFLDALRTGEPLQLRPQNVVHHNSLQVLHAERWVFSGEDNFELARKMIAANPKNRTGPRLHRGGDSER